MWNKLLEMDGVFIFYDMEYDKGGKGDKIEPILLELSLLAVEAKSLEVIDEIKIEYKPERELTKYIVDFLGLDASRHDIGLTYEEANKLIISFIGRYKIIDIYNAGSDDYNVIVDVVNNKIGKGNKYVNTDEHPLILFQPYNNQICAVVNLLDCLPLRVVIDNRFISAGLYDVSLKDLMCIYGVEQNGKEHDSLTDVRNLYEVFKSHISNIDDRHFSILRSNKNNKDVVNKLVNRYKNDLDKCERKLSKFINNLSCEDINWKSIGIPCDYEGNPLGIGFDYLNDNFIASRYYMHAYNINRVYDEVCALNYCQNRDYYYKSHINKCKENKKC